LIDSSGKPIQGLRDGNRLPTAPRFQGSLSVGYEQPVLNGLTGFSNLTWQYVGNRFTQVADQEPGAGNAVLFQNVGNTTIASLSFPLELPSYNIVNLRLGLRNGADWEAAFFIDNLGDERAHLAIDRERGLRARFGYLTNQPRTFGVTLRKSF